MRILSPPSEEIGKGLEISVGLSVTAIRFLSLTDLTISYDLIIDFVWKDPRLVFAHLKVGFLMASFYISIPF